MLVLTVALTSLVLTAGGKKDAGVPGNPDDWNGFNQPAKNPAPIHPAGSGIPDAAKARYADAASKLSFQDYAGATVVLNGLAAEYPKVPEIFASRCSAQLGLKQWNTAYADCHYALSLAAKLPTAVYGLAVAEDGQGKAKDAVEHYREYAALPNADRSLRDQATSRADTLSSRLTAQGAVPPPPPPGATTTGTPPPAQPAAANTSANVVPKGAFVERTPAAGKAVIYVFRNLLMGIGTPTRVLVDGKEVGDLPNDHYNDITVSPGKHTVVLKAAVIDSRRTEPTSTVQLQVAAGQSVYYKLEYAPSNDDVGFTLIPVSPDVGRKEVREDCELLHKKAL